MIPKRLFSSYNWKGNTGLHQMQYCPVCGTKCRMIQKEDRTRPTCPQCGFVHYKNPSTGVAMIVIEEDKVLLGKRISKSYQGGKWCLPCGFVEYDEDFQTAALREVKEETGLEVAIDAILNVTSNFLSPNLHTIVVTLLMRIVGGTLEAGDDLEQLQWFPMPVVFPEMAFEADQDIVEWYQQHRTLKDF